MKKPFLIFIFFLFPVLSFAQNGNADWSWWNDRHGWEVGDPGWRTFMIISPGYLGPNALPVPDVKRGFLTGETEFELTASNHFHSDDPTQDLSGRIYIPFAGSRIAVEMYGVLFEYYHYSEAIRDQRVSRDMDGTGVAIGDFYFSTLIQIIKDRKFPNTLFRFAARTASGSALEAARYSDTPGYFFDLSFSKDLGHIGNGLIRPFGGIGFYGWQTTDDELLQNDALMYALGLDFENETSRLSASWSGYSGYQELRDRPMQLNFEWRKDFDKTALRFQYQHGLRDWEYKTIRFSFLWKMKGVE